MRMRDYTYEDAFTLLKEVLLDNFRVTEKDIYPKATFKDDLGLDSLDMVDLLDYIELRYGDELVLDSNEEYKQKFYEIIPGTVHDMALFLQMVINNHQRSISNGTN